MRARLLVLLLCAPAAGCGSDDGDDPGGPDGAVAPQPDAAVSVAQADANPTEDLDMKLADFGDIQGLTKPTGRNYFVANPLGHMPEALAAATTQGGTFPVGSILLVQKAEVMVKRRAGWNPGARDWEFFRVRYAADGTTPAGFEVRGATETACFSCHSAAANAPWDFVCDHP